MIETLLRFQVASEYSYNVYALDVDSAVIPRAMFLTNHSFDDLESLLLSIPNIGKLDYEWTWNTHLLISFKYGNGSNLLFKEQVKRWCGFSNKTVETL